MDSVKATSSGNTWYPLGEQLYIAGGVMYRMKPTDNIITSGTSYTIGSADYLVSAIGSRGLYTLTAKFSGALVSSAVVHSGGSMIVKGQGNLVACEVESGGTIHVSNGGTALKVYVSEGGIILGTQVPPTYSTTDYAINRYYLLAGYTAYNIPVYAAPEATTEAILTIGPGGKLSNCMVYERGILQVASGGSAYNCSAIGSGTSEAHINVQNNASLVSAYIGSMGNLIVRSAGVASRISVPAGTMTVESGAHAENCAIAGSCFVTSGGIMSACTVNYGSLTVSSGASIYDTYVTGGNNVRLYPGAVVSTIGLGAGPLRQSTGCPWTGVYISGQSANTSLTLTDSCTGLSLETVNKGYTVGNVYMTGTAVVDGGYQRDTDFFISSGATVKDFVVSGGSMHLSSGSVLSNLTVCSDGKIAGTAEITGMVISGGSVSLDLTSAADSHVTIQYIKTGVSSGSLDISANPVGGTDNVLVNSYYHGGSAFKIGVTGSSPYNLGASYTSMSNQISGIIFESCTIGSYSEYYPGNPATILGGSVTNVLLGKSYAGQDTLSAAGGAVIGTTVLSGGICTLTSCIVSSVLVTGGPDGGAGSAVTKAGCIASNVTVSGFVRTYYDTDSTGSQAQVTAVESGVLQVSGGTVISGTVTAGGRVDVYSGGYLGTDISGYTINSGGTVFVSASGYGKVSVNPGGTLWCTSGGSGIYIDNGGDIRLDDGHNMIEQAT